MKSGLSLLSVVSARIEIQSSKFKVQSKFQAPGIKVRSRFSQCSNGVGIWDLEFPLNLEL
jgi:hypothetical protein